MWYFLDLIVPQVKEESCSKFLNSSAAVVRDQFAPRFIAFHMALRIKLIQVQNPRQQQHW
jgi:hypothetical protein